MLKLKENRGITLIALVITIIILLILAGITIGQLQNSGLFGKTQTAKEKYTYESAKEQLRLRITELQTEKYAKGEGNSTLNDLKIYLEDSKFEGEYSVELFYEPLATTEEVQPEPEYAKVIYTPAEYEFIVDKDLIIVSGEKVTIPEPPILMTGLFLDKTNETLTVNQEMTITATILPENANNKTVNWRSSDTSKVEIVSFVDNTVTIRALQETGGASIRILATARDGSNVKATCNVQVVAASE